MNVTSRSPYFVVRFQILAAASEWASWSNGKTSSPARIFAPSFFNAFDRRARLSRSADGTMSMSLVSNGEPYAAAAKPPIRMKSTWCAARARNIATPLKLATRSHGPANLFHVAQPRLHLRNALVDRLRKPRLGEEIFGSVVAVS